MRVEGARQREGIEMGLVIELPPDLDRQLRREAEREGTDPGTYVLRLVARQLGPTPPDGTSALTAEESSLLQQINLGIPTETWERYHELIERRRAETLTEPEQRELIGISDQIEAANARRIEYLAALAHLRGTTVRALMYELGVAPGSDA
jgi:hypothetical protein